MSGGSYNYLFVKDASELLSHMSELEEMAERLAGLGYAQDAAAETYELLQKIRQYEIMTNVTVNRLAGVWRSVEYWDSADCGEEAVKNSLEEYRS